MQSRQVAVVGDELVVDDGVGGGPDSAPPAMRPPLAANATASGRRARASERAPGHPARFYQRCLRSRLDARARRPRRRLRRPVRPAHRPPGARAAVYSEIVPNRITAAEVAARRPAALILSGGPKSVHVDGAPSLDPAIYDLGVPILGICYGAQLIAQQLGGIVGRGMRGEYGRAKLRRTGPSLAAARRRTRRPRRVDEPLRRHHRRAGRVHGHGRRPTTRPSPCWRTTSAASTACSSTPRSSTRPTAWACCGASCTSGPGAHRRGRCRRSSTSRSHASAPRSATAACCARCPAASTRRSPRRSCTAPSATS